MLVSTLHQVAWLCQARCVVGAGKSELCSGTPNTHVLLAHADRPSMPQFPQLTCQISVGTAVSLTVVLILAVVSPGALTGAGSCRRWRKPQFYHRAAPITKHQLRTNHITSLSFSCFSCKMKLNIFVHPQNGFFLFLFSFQL